MTCVTYLLLRKMFFITINKVLKAKLCLLCVNSLEKNSTCYSSYEVFTGTGFFFPWDMNKNFRVILNAWNI